MCVCVPTFTLHPDAFKTRPIIKTQPVHRSRALDTDNKWVIPLFPSGGACWEVLVDVINLLRWQRSDPSGAVIDGGESALSLPSVISALRLSGTEKNNNNNNTRCPTFGVSHISPQLTTLSSLIHCRVVGVRVRGGVLCLYVAGFTSKYTHTHTHPCDAAVGTSTGSTGNHTQQTCEE